MKLMDLDVEQLGIPVSKPVACLSPFMSDMFFMHTVADLSSMALPSRSRSTAVW